MLHVVFISHFTDTVFHALKRISFRNGQQLIKSLWQLTIHLRVFSCPRRKCREKASQKYRTIKSPNLKPPKIGNYLVLQAPIVTRGVHRTHTPRRVNVYRPGCMQCSYTIDVTMRIEQGGYCVYWVRVWPYPRCGSDRLLYIQHIILWSWGGGAKCYGNSWKKQPKQ